MSEEEKKGKPQLPKTDLDNPTPLTEKGGTKGGKMSTPSEEIQKK
ncbi:hypothetical protein [Chryseobacterium sp. ERMR1:04]|nr:hypothetical protein [Chryseobacterium sp. ERMR1:04]